MSEESNINIRLSKAAKEFNVGRETIVEFLTKKGFQIDPSPNTKLTSEMYALLVKEYQGEREVKNEAKKLGDLSYKGGSVSVDSTVQSSAKDKDEDDNEEVFIRTSTIVKDTQPKEVKTEKPKEKETPKSVAPAEPIEEKNEQEEKESPLKVVGKIDLDSLNAKTRPDKKTKEEKQREAKEKAEREAAQKKAERLKAERQAEEAKKAEDERKAL